MSERTDPELERRIVASIREPLLAAIGRADAPHHARAQSRRLVAAVCALVLIAGAGVVALRFRHDEDATRRTRVGGTSVTTSPVAETTTSTLPIPPPRDPRLVVVGGNQTIRLRNRPRPVGSGVGTGVTATPDGRTVAYEYDTPTAHVIAEIDTATCDASGCTETVVALGHSPVLSAKGVLAYIALDDDAPVGPNEAMWKRAGSIAVRSPGGGTEQWGHDVGFQTVGWAGDSLIVERDDPGADTEGFEQTMLYVGPNQRTVIAPGLVAVNQDGTRLLLGGAAGGDKMLELYDVAARRVVDSITIAAYEAALVSPAELIGHDLTTWPGFEDAEPWPITCCAAFDGDSLWQGDLVLLPSMHADHWSDGAPDRSDLRPTIVRIVGDRIAPVMAVTTGRTEYDDVQWMPGTTDEFAAREYVPGTSSYAYLRCRIEGTAASCAADPEVQWVFDLPTIAGELPTSPRS